MLISVEIKLYLQSMKQLSGKFHEHCEKKKKLLWWESQQRENYIFIGFFLLFTAKNKMGLAKKTFKSCFYSA